MFKKMYASSVLFNLFISITLVPFLIGFIVSRMAWVYIAEKESLLNYIADTGDAAFVEHPAHQYQYQHAVFSADGELVEASNMDPTDTLYEAKRNNIQSIQDGYFDGTNRTIFTPRDDHRPGRHFFHTSVDEYYFSNCIVTTEGTDYTVVHTLIYAQSYTFAFASHRANTAGLYFVSAIFLCSIIFAYLEIRPLKRAWAQQKQFTAHASHELRTPIFVAKMVLEQCEGKEDGYYAEKHAMIKHELDIMSAVVNDLTFMSRMDAKQIEVTRQDVSLASVLQRAYQSAAVVAESKNIALSLLCNGDFTVKIDAALIQQAVGILLNNAIEYTNPGGFVAVSVDKKGKRIRIAVEDSGRGIPKKEIGNIFRRFYRIDSNQTSKKGNSGMGLAIAKWIVSQHKGEIRVESEVGMGSRFTISLPAGKR